MSIDELIRLATSVVSLRVIGQNVCMECACFPLLAGESGVARLWKLRVAGVLAYLWNVWFVVGRWFGTGRRLQVSSATAAWNAGRAVRGNAPM